MPRVARRRLGDVERGGGRYGVFVFGWRRGSMSHEDPSVAAVEAILGADALTVQPRPRSAVRPIASHALWICACVTVDDAPTWLIYDTEDGVSWCRVADKMEPLDLVNARLTAGGHADPAQVLLWLEGKDPTPWGNCGSGWGEAAVLAQLLIKIRHR